ncbi:MAG: hypothetical protein V4734_10455 [Terriglobus sp.]
MADALSARETYLAGAHDFEIAAQQLVNALGAGEVAPDATEAYLQDALLHLFHGRIERGEIPSDNLPQGRAA